MTPPSAAATARTAPARPRPAHPARPRPRAVPAPLRGRRVSGPAATARGGVAAPARRPAPAPLAGGAELLDRLIRGRVWIGLVAVALVGLVFLQVSLLSLNSGIGRAVQTSATLERQNAMLRAEVSRLDSGERIQTVAQGLGLVMPAPGDRRYLRAGGEADAARAAKALSAPDPVVQTPLASGTAAVQVPAGAAEPTISTPAPQPVVPPVTTPHAHQAQAAPAPQPQTQAQPQASPPAQTVAPGAGAVAAPTGG